MSPEFHQDPQGIVSLTLLTHLLSWEGWLHPARGQGGTLGLTSISCGTEGRTQSRFSLGTSHRIYQNHFQCFYHPTPEQGCTAKMSPKRCKRPFRSLPVTRRRKPQSCISVSQKRDAKLIFPRHQPTAALACCFGQGLPKTKTLLPRAASTGGHTQFVGTAQAWLHSWARVGETRRWLKAVLAGSSFWRDTRATGDQRNTPSHGCHLGTGVFARKQGWDTHLLAAPSAEEAQQKPLQERRWSLGQTRGAADLAQH